MTWRVNDVDLIGDRHVTPDGDDRAHDLTVNCWCQPNRDEQQPLVVVHNSADGREQQENTDKPKLVELRPRGRSPREALEVLDQLRADIVIGKIVAFSAVGIDCADTCFGYASATLGVSRLRMQGAIAQLLHDYLAGELGDLS